MGRDTADTMKKLFFSLVLVLALTGCSSLGIDPALFENDVVCSVAMDNAYTLSQYGPVGISGKVRAKSAAVLCKAPAATAPSTVASSPLRSPLFPPAWQYAPAASQSPAAATGPGPAPPVPR